jgi:hypothetical protein
MTLRNQKRIDYISAIMDSYYKKNIHSHYQKYQIVDNYSKKCYC